MADDPKSATAIPTLEDWQHWTLVMGRAQQMLMEFWAEQMKKGQPMPSLGWTPPAFGFGDAQPSTDPMALMSAGAQAWAKGLEAWGKVLGGVAATAPEEKDRKDRRFAAPGWQQHPFDLLTQAVLLGEAWWNDLVDNPAGVNPRHRRIIRFTVRQWLDMISPSNVASS